VSASAGVAIPARHWKAEDRQIRAVLDRHSEECPSSRITVYGLTGWPWSTAMMASTTRSSRGQSRRARSSSLAPSSMPSRKEPISSARTSGPVASSVASRIASNARSFSSLLERLGIAGTW
jgi:hypothetical protein